MCQSRNKTNSKYLHFKLRFSVNNLNARIFFSLKQILFCKNIVLFQFDTSLSVF